MKSISLAVATLLNSVLISACENAGQQDKTEIALSSEQTSTKRDRETKPPGCQTLIDMGQLEQMEILNVSEMDLDTAVNKQIEKFANVESVLVLRNKNTINSCTIHQVHVKDIRQSPTSPRQAIFVFLEDQQSGNLDSAGAKVTCWKDPVEKWHPLSDCE